MLLFGKSCHLKLASYFENIVMVRLWETFVKYLFDPRFPQVLGHFMASILCASIYSFFIITNLSCGQKTRNFRFQDQPFFFVCL